METGADSTKVRQQWRQPLNVTGSPTYDSLEAELEALEPFGKIYFDSSRGTFEVVEHGIQHGPGSKVGHKSL